MNPQSEPATPLPATDLTEESILDIFKLTRDTRPEIWTLAGDEVSEVPQHIGKPALLPPLPPAPSFSLDYSTRD